MFQSAKDAEYTRTLLHVLSQIIEKYDLVALILKKLQWLPVNYHCSYTQHWFINFTVVHLFIWTILVSPVAPTVPPINYSLYKSLTSAIVVSSDKSWGFPFRCDNLKNILVRPFKFGMWVYMGNATNSVVL